MSTLRSTRSGRSVKPVERFIEDDGETKSKKSSDNNKRLKNGKKIDKETAEVESGNRKKERAPAKNDPKSNDAKKVTQKNEVNTVPDNKPSLEKRSARNTQKVMVKTLVENGSSANQKKSGKRKVSDERTNSNDDNTNEESEMPEKRPKRAAHKEAIKTLEEAASALKPRASKRNNKVKDSNDRVEENNQDNLVDEVTVPSKKTRGRAKKDIAPSEPTSSKVKPVASKAETTNRNPKKGNKVLTEEEIEALAYLSDDSDQEKEDAKVEEDAKVKEDPKMKGPVTRKKNMPIVSDAVEAKDTKKVPIYMRSAVEPKISANPRIETLDPFEMSVDSDEEEAKKKKKKRTKRKPKKKEAGIILPFGSAKKSNVALALKQMKNLKTPVQKKTEQPEPKVKSPRIVVTEHENEEIAVNYDDDDNFEPPPVDDEMVAPEPMISTPDSIRPQMRLSPSYKPQEKNEQDPPKRYKTPVVPKHMSKVRKDQKASTPRQEEISPKPIPQKPPTKAELMRKCFDFDESSENDDSKTDNESLVDGISPVRNVISNRILMTPAAGPSRASNSFTQIKNSTATTQQYLGGQQIAKPSRFEFFRRPAVQSIRPSMTSYASTTSNSKSNRLISIDKANPKANEVKIIMDPTSSRQQKRRGREPSKSAEVVEQVAEKAPEQVGPNGDDDDTSAVQEDQLSTEQENAEKPSSWTTVSEVSLYDELIDVDEQEAKPAEVESEECEEPPALTNAFEILNNVGKRRPNKNQHKNAKNRPLKTVTNTLKATKQSLIYETDGGQKTMKSRRTKQPSSNDNEENTSNVQRTGTARTYRKNALNTSISAVSPRKKDSKKDRQLNQLATTINSHHSEIDAFDLTFN